MPPSTPTATASRDLGFGKLLFSPDELKKIKDKLKEKDTSQKDAISAIDKANKIFGYNGWSVTVLKVDAHDAKEDSDKVWAYSSAAVRIVLKDGTVREGFGFAEAKRGHKDNARTAAKQAAIRDATRHALKGFGANF